MLVQALYNIVDSIFVSRISENALTAVTLAFPMQTLMISFGGGTSVGVNALLSKALGEKKFDRSDKAANMGLFLTFFSYLLFLIIGLTAAEGFIRSQTDNAEIIGYGTTYLSIVCLFSFGMLFQMMLERLLQSTGKTIYSMISQLTGAVINIIFDPILIFGLAGFPRLGVAGAAWATVLGQIVAAILGIFFNIKFNTEIRLSFRSIFKPDGAIIKQIYLVGVPSILMMSIGSVMTYLMNKILIAFSTTAAAVFGAYFKLQSFFFMPLFGLNNGLIPVLAYNYGAKKKERIEEALRFSIILAVSIMLVGMVCFMAFPDRLLDLFDASDAMKEIGVPALRTIAFHFPIAGACIAMGSVFQAFSKSIFSLIVSVSRQLVVLIPAAWLLAQTGSVQNVWWAFLISEVASLIASLTFFIHLHKTIIAKL
ncbi:MAG: MATE family efflux transporter [Lachnospiraceae bacterium]|nr:MATE family efflux transporter [Lachnospiraceae bacterium]